MDIQTKLSKARTHLLLDKRYTFWATIGLYQQPIENNHIDTMATDGYHLYYNKEFVESLSHQELMFVLAHEAGHCALGHHLRRQEREKLKWNIAADYALNLILTTHPCNLTPPEKVKNKEGKIIFDKCLLDKKWENKSTEQIYNELKVLKIPF